MLLNFNILIHDYDYTSIIEIIFYSKTFKNLNYLCDHQFMTIIFE
jgi:hypothetical protein